VQFRGYLNVTNEYPAQTNIAEKFSYYASVAVVASGKVIVNVNVVVEIASPDGSKIKFKIKGIDADHHIVVSFSDRLLVTQREILSR
jgi:hypothetical protein